MTIDVVIPTYKPDEELITIIHKLREQTCPPRRIVLMNTEQKYIENLFRGRAYDELGKYIEVKHVSEWEFDHGGTRNAGASGSDADFLLFMTQDAIPVDNDLIANLLSAFEDESVASAYARQLPREDAGMMEVFTRNFNYPAESRVKSSEDKNQLGIKTYFCSNACAMYRGKVYFELGMFPKNMIFNEDMVFAHKVIESGYKIAYVAEARVMHSHNYTNMQQFHRNFDLAVSQAMHPEVFESISSEAEGSSYVKSAFKYLCEKRRPWIFIPFAVTCAFRLLGYKMGKNYKKLSKRQILKCTMSPKFFKKQWR